MCNQSSTRDENKKGIDLEAPPVGFSELAPSIGFHLRWSRVVKTVQIKAATSGLLRGSIAAPSSSSRESFAAKSGGPVIKTILDEVSGSAKPGEVLAMMGPSGSGKTSLLNVLSGRSSYDSGIISINGEPLTAQSRKKLMSKIAYVKQSDVFFDQLTVRDQLTYTALLRLPPSIPKEEKIQEVDRVISLLRLNKVADSSIRLCSGGEKKRVNICTELLTDPLVLLLDEPTSGLDSTSAVALIKLLQKLCRSENKTVITSIHQPSSAVFRSFDKLLMLAEGHVVYFGTPVASLTYLSDLNFKTLDGYNAADHWMDLLVRDNLIAGESGDDGKSDDNLLDGTERSEASTDSINGGLRRPQKRKSSVVDHNTPRGILIDSWDNDAVAEALDAETRDVVDGEGVGDAFVLDVMKKYNNTWWTQYVILTHRSLKNTRSKIFTPLNLIKSAVIGIIAGLLYFQLEHTEKSVRDMSSFFFFTMTYWVFDSMYTALYAFPAERTVILKERASASYRLSAYFMAKTTSEAPTRLVLPLIYNVIAFWMTGVNNKFSVFLGQTGCILLSVLSGEVIGLLIGASMYDLPKALALISVLALLLMLLGGFFVDNVPAFVSWARYLSAFKYAFDASQELVFDENIPCDGSGVLEEICGGSDEGFASPEQLKEFLQVEGTIGFNVGMLFVISTIPRYLAYLALRSKKSGDRE